ncbi:uncharacterized protein N0V89_002367 [Didymosphaeria variabile]|uniref:Uncharacterized protein n=1 Tax=Didymosphaeria variabile TaxID=1932322 RepID=A0A9W8XSD2_9PLEO|nr:uncharacterized protein N0V89_002367 [Didymosphaeria variabile]KAJ4357791.1 hypothetical protein N0V89_002367 [Didymosphaeria variabile]
MASKLCCTTEQEGHPDSPELPNGRMTEAPTPARLPLLPKPVGSVNSRFTSARTEDLHELRQIFDNAKDNEPTRLSPTKAAARARFTKPSIYSLHSIHRMKSMRSLIRRKFSRDLAKKPFGDLAQSNEGKKAAKSAPETVIKQHKSRHDVQLQITKDDLRKDLLSDKRRDEGGYDSDAQVLDDIAKNIGKKTPNKRPSIHSIDWTPSTTSKPTPGSSPKSRQSSDRARDLQPYHIKPTHSVSLTTRLGQVFSSPNLQADTSKAQERRMRRSHSATSIRLPEYSPSPLRLPSLRTHDPDGIPWSVALNESLRLSHSPIPPRPLTPQQSRASLKVFLSNKRSITKVGTQEISVPKEASYDKEAEQPTPSTVVQIHVQEPNALPTPRQSGSLGVFTRGNPTSIAQESAKEPDAIEEDQPRRSSFRVQPVRFAIVPFLISAESPSPSGSPADTSDRHLAQVLQVLEYLPSGVSTKKSKFREEFSPSPPKKKLIPSASIMRFFTPKRNSLHSQSEARVKPGGHLLEVDGSLEVPGAATQRERRQSKSAVSLEAEQKALGKDKKASPMWERALQNYQDEKAAMLLPKNKELATHTSPFRERSGSVSQPRVSEESNNAKLSASKRFSAPLLGPPSPGAAEFEDSPSLYVRRTAFLGTDPNALDPDQKAHLHFTQQTDTIETVGAWGRYPSHTRADRTFSASHQDQVETRDFALEAAIKFALDKTNVGDDGDDGEEEIDPATRPITPPLLPGQKKRKKKKIGNTRMAKSRSMTFGKSFLKNYAKIFRSQSIEFHRHGQGHRSSIATGGTLEYPELEIIPDLWKRGIIKETSQESSHGNEEACTAQEEYGPGDKKGKGKMKEEDSTATLRPLPTSSRPTTSNQLQAGLDGTKDIARVWSAYYENCLPSFPRASTELDFSAEDFGATTRRSLENRRASMHSRTMPVRYVKHSRNASRMSHLSRVSWHMICDVC